MAKYWETFDPASSSGADLAKLRQGLGREPGAVPGMWPFYRVRVPERLAAAGYASDELVAEHAALALFGLHQQSQRVRMHSDAMALGTALRRLRDTGRYSPDAVDRRVTAAATATGVGELVGHLRGLVTQLRSESIPLNYTDLYRDLTGWRWPDVRARTRRRWGAQYYTWTTPDADTETTQD